MAITRLKTRTRVYTTVEDVIIKSNPRCRISLRLIKLVEPELQEPCVVVAIVYSSWRTRMNGCPDSEVDFVLPTGN